MRSYIDLGLNLSASIFLNLFFSIITGPIEAKFHEEPPCSNGLGHMTKMAAMPIHCKSL